MDHKKKHTPKKESSHFHIFFQTSSSIPPSHPIPFSFDSLIQIKDRQDIQNFAIFKKNHEPLYENDEYLQGGFYEFIFSSSSFQQIPFDKFMESLLRLLQKYSSLLGVRFRPKGNKMKVQIWSSDKLNSSILHTLQKIPTIFHIRLEENPRFELFYPEPLPDSPDISVVEMRGKKVHILRFGIMISNFFHSKKVWWEIEMLPVFKKYYVPNTNIIDIGANIGSHSLLMSEIISPNSLIFSFEPVYWDIVQKNIFENHLQDKICLFPQGLGKRNEVIEINTMDRMKPNNFGQLSIVKKIKTAHIKKKIGVITLDSIHLHNISLIKIDVEGMEKDVLEGARNTIAKNLPTIIIEIWSDEMENFIQSDIGKFLFDQCKYKLIPLPHSASNHDYILEPPK